MRFRKDEGFTLVELMVVVLIIGILVAIAIPVFNSARSTAWRRSCHANQRTIEGACQTYNADMDALPASVGDLSPTYIKVDPVCPRTGSTCDQAAGGYTLTASPGDTVQPCTGGEGTSPNHGHYTD